jgi:hypothetical protein
MTVTGNLRARTTPLWLLVLPVAALAAIVPAHASAATRADFSVDLAGPATARVGEESTYVVTVTNNGPDAWPGEAEFSTGESEPSGSSSTSWGVDVVSVERTREAA